MNLSKMKVNFLIIGLESEGISGTSSSYSSGTGINNFPTPAPLQGFSTFGSFGSFPDFESTPFRLPNKHHTGPLFGGSYNNRFNRNIGNIFHQQGFEDSYPQLDIYRERRNLGPQQFNRPGNSHKYTLRQFTLTIYHEMVQVFDFGAAK